MVRLRGGLRITSFTPPHLRVSHLEPQLELRIKQKSSLALTLVNIGTDRILNCSLSSVLGEGAHEPVCVPFQSLKHILRIWEEFNVVL